MINDAELVIEHPSFSTERWINILKSAYKYIDESTLFDESNCKEFTLYLADSLSIEAEFLKLRKVDQLVRFITHLTNSHIKPQFDDSEYMDFMMLVMNTCMEMVVEAQRHVDENE